MTDDNPANMAALVLRHGLDAAHPLNTQLNHSEMLRLGNAANKAGVPGGVQTLNMMRPWLAALTIATAPLLKAGLDPEHGVDKQLKSQMTTAGKKVLGLETAEQQIGFLADMPQAVQLALLRSTLRDFDNASIQLTQLIDAWEAGDVETIARLEDEEMRQKQPRLYQRLLVQRNRNWAARVDDLLRHEHRPDLHRRRRRTPGRPGQCAGAAAQTGHRRGTPVTPIPRTNRCAASHGAARSYTRLVLSGTIDRLSAQPARQSIDVPE